MKTSKFISKAKAFADGGCISADAEALSMFISAFSNAPDSALTSVVEKLDAVQVPKASANEPALRKVRGTLRKLHESLPTRERKSTAKDFEALDTLLSHRDSGSLSEFVASVRRQFASNAQPKGKRKAPVNQTLVDQYVPKLEAALGDDAAFKQAFDALDADPQIGQAEAVAISKAFMGRTASSMSRKAAMERIWSRHAALLNFKAKRKAFGGRTAA